MTYITALPPRVSLVIHTTTLKFSKKVIFDVARSFFLVRVGIILGKPPGQAVGWTYTGIKALIASRFGLFRALCDHNLCVLILFDHFEV